MSTQFHSYVPIFDYYDDIVTNKPKKVSEIIPTVTDDTTINGTRVIEVTVPGYNKTEISITYLKDILTIKSKEGIITNKLKQTFLLNFSCKENTYDIQNVSILVADGILSVTIPLKEQATEINKVITIL